MRGHSQMKIVRIRGLVCSPSSNMVTCDKMVLLSKYSKVEQNRTINGDFQVFSMIVLLHMHTMCYNYPLVLCMCCLSVLYQVELLFEKAGHEWFVRHLETSEVQCVHPKDFLALTDDDNDNPDAPVRDMSRRLTSKPESRGRKILNSHCLGLAYHSFRRTFNGARYLRACRILAWAIV